MVLQALTNLIGMDTSTPITSYIATHNSRLRCFVDKFLDINLQNKKKVLRFKNTAVLKLTLTKSNIKLEMVYSGEIDLNENKKGYTYYVKEGEEKPEGAVYEQERFPTFEKENDKYHVDEDKEYVFYIMRHGQATHNTKSGLSKMAGSLFTKDTPLTDKGIEQANNAGKKVKSLGLPSANYLFASDLQRTRSTLNNFLKESGIAHPDNITILACSHELEYVKGECDGNQGITPAENVMNCTKDKCTKEDILNLNWDNYYSFYDNNTRNCITCKRKHCRKTDMIEIALEIITGKDLPVAIPTGDEKRGGNKYYISYSPT